MEYRIGVIPRNFGFAEDGHKFVINEENGKLVYYAKKRGFLDNLDYSDIIEEHKLRNVRATGLVDHGGGGIKILGIWSGRPIEMKGATKSLMRNFELILLESYKQICPTLEKVVNLCVER